MKVWRRWFEIGSIYGLIAGLWIVIVAMSPEWSGIMLRSLFPPERAGSVTDAVRVATAVSGALTAGWSLTAWLARPRGEPGDRRTARAFAVGFTLWFVIDSAMSVWLGAALNAAGNVTWFLAMVPPSVALARSET